MALLKVSNLCKTYYKGENKIYALRNINFDVEEGEFVSIVGKSGSGKSTLLNLLGGMDTSAEGSVCVGGINILTMSEKQLSQYRKFTVGMIFQSFNLIPTRTAIDNVKLPLIFSNYPRRLRETRACELLYNMGLYNRALHYPSELSGGEAQRVAIARALANKPKIILADEPTGNLDTATSAEIISLLQMFNKKHHITIIMVTHDKETAGRVSHKTVLLSDGEIIKITTNPNP
ncbi:MAG: ABC transporter ATP-binding protein [Bacteroidales bacterium]|nr:ABC transporter ATP-binding protein [Bacteroidales bacterium]MBO7567172.1 ABC transporter ATP-binding protein [Bacteroidales bacterium]MBP5682749.1 ABC transporter ATP-binding protein [Bacteroidales bacterium]